MAASAGSSFLRKPRFEENGQLRGLTAIGVESGIGKYRRMVMFAYANEHIQWTALHSKPNLHPCISRKLLHVEASDSKKITQDTIRYEYFSKPTIDPYLLVDAYTLP